MNDTARQIETTTPMQLLAIATEKGADLDQMEKLMNLQERWEASQAKKAFFQAMSEFQSKVPSIKKLKEGHNCKYAPIGDIAEQIRKTMNDCGFSYRFEQEHSERIKVICVVTHVDGHSERTDMSAGADSSGNKNGVQAIGSTITYLQRYTLTSALGITTADEDMDGRLMTSDGDFLSGEQTSQLETLLSETGSSRKKFLAYFGAKEPGEIKASQFTRAVTMLERKLEK